MSRFYYRPPDPGLGALGAGLAHGIAAGSDAYFGERDRKKADRRRSVEDV